VRLKSMGEREKKSITYTIKKKKTKRRNKVIVVQTIMTLSGQPHTHLCTMH